jgi:prophage antirepressor-like protein
MKIFRFRGAGMKIKLFKNNQINVEIRTLIDEKGEPWFVAKDVAIILGYTNPQKAIRDHVDDEDKRGERIVTPSGTQEAIVINESGLYSLILKSNKPEAKKFKRWVTAEVLPTIRKTGGYVANDELFIDTYLPFADETTKALFKQTLEIIKQQNKQIQTMKPKADYFDELVDRKLLTNFRDTAKELGIKQNKFIEFLLENKFVYRDNKGILKPYALYNKELFEIKEWVNNGKAGVQTLITPKGRETFRLLLRKSS